MIFCAKELFIGLTNLIIGCINSDIDNNNQNIDKKLMEVVRRCLRPFVETFDYGTTCKVDGIWQKVLGQHAFGEFSMAVIQANGIMEDHSQLDSGPLSSLESGPYGTFAGVYDGHGGAQASNFVKHNLFHNLKRFAAEHEEVSANAIKKAFLATDEEYLSMVRKQWPEKNPELASAGTCCLVGIICDGKLYIANAGDSRVVLGTMSKGSRNIKAVQLSNDHNARLENERDELQALHPNDSGIVVLKHKAWRVKGIIQVTRSLGDAYLKRPEFNKDPLLPKYRVPEPFDKPIIRAEPIVTVAKLQPEDRFLIFASDGLYEHLTNQEVVDIVQNSPRNGVATKLIRTALQEAARKREMRYTDLQKICPGIRRHFHDDITVIVVFFDHFLNGGGSPIGLPFSVKGGSPC